MSNKYSYSNEKKAVRTSTTIKLVILVILILAVIAGIIFLFTRGKPVDFKIQFLGSKKNGMTYEARKFAIDLRNTFDRILIQDGISMESYQIAGKTGNPPSKKSDYCYLKDQINLLGFYAEQKDKSEFNELNENLKLNFSAGNGLFVKRILMSTLQKPKGELEIKISDQLSYCRVLIESYQSFGSSKNLEDAKSIAALIYPLCKENLILPSEITVAVANPQSIPDYWATPVPKPSAQITIDPKSITYIGVVNLADIDLFAMKLLIVVDKRWEEIYNNCLSVIKIAKLAKPAPLYNAGYDVKAKAYIPYLSKEPEFNFSDQMDIVLHLAEVSQIDESAYSYLKQLLFNTNNYYETYQIISASPKTENESIASYAKMARIARIKTDQELYNLCISRLKWNTATNKESQIFALPFRKLVDEKILAFSQDAVLMMKAVF